MNKYHLYLVGLCCILGAMAIAGVLISSSHKYETNESSLDIRNISVSLAETPKISTVDGVMHVSYTISLSGFRDTELSVVSVEIIDNQSGDLVTRLEKDTLRQAYSPAKDRTPSSILINFSVDKAHTPKEVIHRIQIVGTGRAILPFLVSGGIVEITSH